MEVSFLEPVGALGILLAFGVTASAHNRRRWL
jgi:hypothetical protein